MSHSIFFAVTRFTGIIATSSPLAISSSPFSRSVALWLAWCPTL
jgi:hypothetical protein